MKGSKEPFQIPSLDGLRAVSFFIVFLAHAGLGSVVPGGFGVTVFFFLSGFLITTLMRKEHEETGGVSLRGFYLRRVIRILPPFYLVLSLAVVATLAGVLPGELSAQAVAAQALHFANYEIIRHGYGGQPVGTGVYWSLAVEEHFYLGFPLLFLFLRRTLSRPRQQALVLWGLCAGVLAWRCVLVYGLDSVEDRTYLATDTRLDSILFGCALAVYGNPMLDRAREGTERLWKWVLFPLGIVSLLGSFAYHEPHYRESVRYSLQGLALYPVFVVAMRYPDFGPMRLLNWRPVAYAGTLTYSLYLVHHLTLYGVRHHLRAGPWVQGVATLALSLALAWVIFQGVEKPFGRLRKRLPGSRREAAAVALPPLS